MNIGIVCYPTFGGSGAVATELGKALANIGHKIHIISYNLPFKLQEFNENIVV
jgi:pyruvate/2-oxoglutarate dehydrogenase complex dihydrolipoamide dehydrogenase (E3) component